MACLILQNTCRNSIQLSQIVINEYSVYYSLVNETAVADDIVLEKER